ALIAGVVLAPLESGADSSGGAGCGSAGAARSLRTSQPVESVAAWGGRTPAPAAAGKASEIRSAQASAARRGRGIAACNRGITKGVAARQPENLAIDGLARRASHRARCPPDRWRPAGRARPPELPLAHGHVRAGGLRAGPGRPGGARFRRPLGLRD